VTATLAVPPAGPVAEQAPVAGGALWSRLRRSPSALAGGTLVALLLLVTLVSLGWTPYDPLGIDPQKALQASTAAHWLGTDQYGRDVLSRLMAGSQVTVYAGIVSVAIAAGVGIPAGLVAAQRRGVVGELIMRVADVVYGFPALLAAITLTAALGGSTTTAMIAIGVAYIPVFARVTRGSALTVLTSGFVLAARAYGRRPLAVLRRHVLPNIAPVLIVQASMLYAVAILAETGLDFLGLGTPPPSPSWGQMIGTAQDYLTKDPLLTVWPSVTIVLAVLGFTLLGDGLREVLDPGLRR
jgi:peptide/nickel transport system permease protein